MMMWSMFKSYLMTFYLLIFFCLATKNARCSLAAKIIYSNLPMSTNSNGTAKNQSAVEKLKRPATLVKQLGGSSSSPSSSNHTTDSQDHQIQIKQQNNYNARQQFYAANPGGSYQRPKPATSNQQKAPDADADDTFPSPPKTVTIQQNQNYSRFQTAPSATTTTKILQDYQEPIIHHGLLRPVTDSSAKWVIPIQNLNNGNKSNPTVAFSVEDEFRRKKVPPEESYCIVKELVMTERTYKKDLELLTAAFRHYLASNGFEIRELVLFDRLLYQEVFDPLFEFHTKFLKDLEIRLFYW